MASITMVKGLDILLDDDYYQCIQRGRTVIDDIPVLEAAFILPFKARAWLDLTDRKKQGEPVDSKTIKKHRNDVFRLSVLLALGQRVELAESIKQDMAQFLAAMMDEDGLNLKDFGIPDSLDGVVENLRVIYDVAQK